MYELKWIGALLVFCGCGWFGFHLAATSVIEERSLRKLIGVLDFMSCELQYRMTPLPDLCRQASCEAGGNLGKLFLSFAEELESQISPNVQSCMDAALSKCQNLPALTKECVARLQGQILSLEAVRAECRKHLLHLESGKNMRLRSYQTLGLCAGAALVILFV